MGVLFCVSFLSSFFGFPHASGREGHGVLRGHPWGKVRVRRAVGDGFPWTFCFGLVCFGARVVILGGGRGTFAELGCVGRVLRLCWWEGEGGANGRQDGGRWPGGYGSLPLPPWFGPNRLGGSAGVGVLRHYFLWGFLGQ